MLRTATVGLGVCVRRHQYTNNDNGLLRAVSESVRSSEAFSVIFYKTHLALRKWRSAVLLSVTPSTTPG